MFKKLSLIGAALAMTGTALIPAAPAAAFLSAMSIASPSSPMDRALTLLSVHPRGNRFGQASRR